MTEQKLVLVVDDETYWRDRTSMVVKACGFEPMIASGVREVYSLILEHTFVLIITDNNMDAGPRSGIEVLQYVGSRLGRNMPTILQSSEVPDELAVILEVFPGTTFVQKDISSDDAKLIDAIKSKFP